MKYYIKIKSIPQRHKQKGLIHIFTEGILDVAKSNIEALGGRPEYQKAPLECFIENGTIISAIQELPFGWEGVKTITPKQIIQKFIRKAAAYCKKQRTATLTIWDLKCILRRMKKI
jgi:hypothetical protein